MDTQTEKPPENGRRARPITFQPLAALAPMIEHRRRRKGIKSTTAVINAALVAFLLPDAGKKVRLDPEVAQVAEQIERGLL